MANKKISELSSGTTLVGTETLPLVQSSATVKVTARQVKSLDRIDVKNYAAVGDGTTDDYDAIQAAITAAETLANTSPYPNVEIYFPPGVYYLNKATSQNLLLARNNSGQRGWLIFTGPGIVKLSYNVFNFLKFNKVADGDTFQKICVRNMIIDANNSMYGASQASVVGFTGTAALSKVNIQDIIVQNVDVLNVPDPVSNPNGSSYSTGTVSLTNGSATVTGSGTSWTTSNMVVGRVVYFKGNAYDPYTIVSVDSGTQITLDRVYAGTTASGQAYVSPSNVSSGWRGCIVLSVQDTTDVGSAYNIKNIFISDCYWGGGNDGAYIIGYLNGAGTGVNVTCDNIVVQHCRHIQNTPAYNYTTPGSEDSVQVGSYARTKYVRIHDIYSDGTGDGCIEVNQPQDCVISNCTLKNPWHVAFYIGTYGVYEKEAGARCIIQNCNVIVDQAMTDARGISLFTNNSVPLGDIHINNFSYIRRDNNEIPLSANSSGGIMSSGSIDAKRISITGLNVEWSGFAFTSSSGTRRIVGVDIRSAATTRYMPVKIRGYRMYVNGDRDVAASNVLVNGILWSGTNVEWDVEGMDWDVTMTGTVTANAHVGIDNIGNVSGSKFALRRSTFAQSGDSAARGWTIRAANASSQYLRADMTAQDVDFTRLGSGSTEFNFATSSSNKESFRATGIRHILWPAPPTVASAAVLNLPGYGEVITVTGTTTITTINPSYPGRIVTLVLGTAMTFTDGGNLRLNTSYTTADGGVIQLLCRQNGTYTTGTVSVTNSSAVVTGSGTAFDTNLKAGNVFEIAGVPYVISSVDSATQITLLQNYVGSTLSGQSYTARKYEWWEVSRSANA